MFSNITPCCKKYFSSNETFYVQVQNDYVHYIFIGIKYTLGTKLIRKQSPVFKPGTLQRLTFPLDASDIFLRVYDVSPIPPVVIWIQYIISNTSECFRVMGHSPSTADCVEVPC